MSVTKNQRFAASRPCPVCQGHKDLPPGQGQRCSGFLSNDGSHAHCTREEYAGSLTWSNDTQAYPHRLMGDCRCGTRHDPRPISSNGHKADSGKRRIVATYDYRDEADELLFQSVRFDPKDFRQRRPDGNGGWIWKLDDDDDDGEGFHVRRVPYQLPDVLGADPSAVVYVCEGEKDVDRLVALGLVATTNVGGAGKWRPEYSEFLRGRHVVVLPDADEPGRRHAQRVAGSLAGIATSVRILELSGVPSKGDVSDWLDLGGTREELERLAIEAQRWEPDAGRTNEPVPPPSDNVEPFPIHAFPLALRRLICEGAAALPCPVDFLAVPLLGVLGAAIGTSRVIRVKQNWLEGPRLYAGIVADPGAKKSPALGLILTPVYRRQQRLQTEYQTAKHDYDLRSAEYEIQLSAWKQGAPKGGADAAKRPPQPVAPEMAQAFTTDATIEAIARLLASNPRGLLFPRDELSGWVRSMDQYRNGKGADRQTWLSIWSGAPIIVNRKGQREPIVIPMPLVNVVGCIPPDILTDLSDERGREDGFIHRILFAAPESVPLVWTDATVSTETLAAYGQICDQLWGLTPDDGDDGRPIPRAVDLTAAGREAFVEWANEHYAELNGPLPENLRGPWLKLEGYCARFALIIQLARHAGGEAATEDVDRISVLGAAALIEYFKSNARRVYSRLHATPEDQRILRAVKWIRTNSGKATARDLVRNNVAGVKTTEDARRLFQMLSERGYGTVSDAPRGSVEFAMKTLPDTRQDGTKP